MSLILNIDTALDTACISLAEDGKILFEDRNETQKDHASWVQVAIKDLMGKAGLGFQKLHAVGINLGPGSYTGLRIGLSSAKGICYAMNIPLITENSLKIMALSALIYLESTEPEILREEPAICPMIDAGRMEVFTAIYDIGLEELLEPQALILEGGSFEKILKRQKILFLGNGIMKFQPVCQNLNAIFKKMPLNPLALATLTYKYFIGNNFADLPYTEPLYLKEFFTKKTEPKGKID